ncbi:hypothetical protein [Clostridium sp.]|uniref:hypothetical protein n=1 Tax=Clostridium sp. TaxID=1506 RepID=UPI001E080189|nr:hypothetical protein [Clostridium sp.]MBS5937106.1 hypothetical protein [Clostridium sp.]
MCLDLVLRNTTDTIFTTNQVKVEIGLKFDDKIEYIPLGIFNISDVKKDDFTTKFTCYDNMFKFDTAYFSKLGDIPTLTQVVNELASITGIQFIGSLPSYTVKKLEGFTCREILSYVASLCGGNALITRDGKFTIIYPTDVNRDIGEGVFDLKRDEVKYKIGKVTCQIKEKETISKGSLGTDSMELQFENPWVTDSILTDIYNRLNGFSYLGYTMKWQGDLSLDVGDIITHIDAKGVNRKLPILNRKLSYDGGLDSELSAKGETKNSNSFNSNGSMKNKVDRVVTEVALINEAFINYAKINDADITNLKAETAKIHNLEVETANINTLLAGNIGSGSIQTIHLTGKNVVIDNAVIKDGMIDTVNANKINTGTLDTNKVTVQGPSGNLLIKDNTIQIKDSTRVRVQIGKDASGDYSMYVWDKQGNVMFDALGLKSSAIKDKIIRDDMVSDNANINGSKLNISSLITEVNKDNTQTLKASKIALDSTGQSLEISFNSLKSNVDNIEVVGRNLVFNSTGNLGIEGWNNGGVANFTTVENGGVKGNNSLKLTGRSNDTARKNISQSVLSKFADLNDLKHVTLSFWYKASEDSDLMGVGSFLRISNRASSYNDVLNSTNSLILDNNWHYKSITGDLSKFNNTEIREIQLFFFTYLGTVDYSNIKLEFGTKDTDWTAAPEDIDSKIEANTTAITVAQGKIEGIIKDTSITKGDVTTLKDKYTSIKATVDGINSTVSSHTSSIGALNSNVSTMQGSINQLNDQIALKVEQTDINKAINSINTDNLIIDNSFENDGYGWSGTVEIESGTGVDGGKCLRLNATTSTRSFVVNKLIDVLPGQKYKVGVWYKTSSDNNGTEGNQKVRLGAESGALLYALALLPGANEWTYKEGIYKIPSGIYKIKLTVSTDAKVGYMLVDNISFINVELESNVSSIDTRLKTAELAITKDAIISTVSATINTAKADAINSANSSTDNKLTNYSTTTAMNTAITQSANGVKTEVSNTYATKTALGQTTTKVESLEQKVTATAITTTISSAINAGTNSISTTQFVMDKNGLTIKNGALTIKNKANANVLTSDTNGNLTITGTFINKNNNGVDAIKIDSTNIYFYDWDRNARELGIIYSSSLTDYPNVKGFSLAHNQQGYMTLGYRKGTNSFGSYITFDKYGINPTYAAPIRVHESTVFHSAVNMQDRVYMPYTLYLGNNAGTTVPMIFGTNNKLVMQVSVSNKDDGLKIQSNTGSVLAQILAGYSYPILLNNNTQVSGNLSATGTKARLVNTKSYGGVRLNALETADALFEDVGEGITDDIGVCYIYLDSVMQETINTKYNYQVFLQKYGEGDLFVLERTENYFIVKGTENLKFAWRFVAKQKGYEMERLEQEKIIVPEEFYSNIEHEKETNYDELASDYLNNFEMELMNIG